MSLKFKLEQLFLNILDKITYKRCSYCDEITIDGICDYCISH